MSRTPPTPRTPSEPFGTLKNGFLLSQKVVQVSVDLGQIDHGESENEGLAPLQLLEPPKKFPHSEELLVFITYFIDQ